jgi:predicted DNA-binding protein
LRKDVITISIRLSREEKLHLDNLLERYHCNFARSQSERFRELLEKLDSPYDRNFDDVELEAEAQGSQEHEHSWEAEGEDPDAVLEGESEDDPDEDIEPDEDPDEQLDSEPDDPDDALFDI